MNENIFVDTIEQKPAANIEQQLFAKEKAVEPINPIMHGVNTVAEVLGLKTRDELFQELVNHSPALARGRTRDRKDSLIKVLLNSKYYEPYEEKRKRPGYVVSKPRFVGSIPPRTTIPVDPFAPKQPEKKPKLAKSPKRKRPSNDSGVSVDFPTSHGEARLFIDEMKRHGRVELPMMSDQQRAKLAAAIILLDGAVNRGGLPLHQLASLVSVNSNLNTDVIYSVLKSMSTLQKNVLGI